MVAAPTPEQKQLFFELLDLDANARAERLAALADRDPILERRLRELLDAHSRAESALGALDAASSTEIDALHAGREIGPYRLERELGEGGFGRVWLAEQLEPIRRPVALKLLKAGMDTREVVGRFQAERQALARMSHPGIAKVFDAGETDRGRPWFAMEFVDGSPITAHCDARRSDLHSRLELFAAVCRAVQHAHTKGVVHRDLKPNNVLVTEVDGVPQPKIIDFGIAKAVEEPLVDDSPRTRGGQWMGTPAFMAPEQLDAAADVDTRADVYSLGALLYVLLVGRAPFDDESGGGATWHDRIRTERPTRASNRVERTADRSRPGVTRAALRRELDWIIARCLEKDPDRRYDSAAVLANEVERVIAGEPVLAGPPGVTYRLSSFVRRNRVTLAVAASVFLILFTALLFALDREARARGAEAEALASATLAREAERQAREELTRSQAVARLTEHMLLSVKPSVARGADTALMTRMLERAEQYILEAEEHAPATEADLARMVGGAWWELGEYQRALPHFERSLELRRASLGDDAAETLESAQMLGSHYLTLGDLVRAEPLLRECVDAYPAEALTTSASARLAAAGYGELLYKRGRLEEALELRRELVRADEATLGPRHGDTLRSRNNLALTLESLERFDEADAEYRAVLALQLSDPNIGPDHPHTLMTRSNLSGLLREQGRLEEAREMCAEVLAAKRRVLPPGHLSLLTSVNNLGELEKRLGNTARAEALYREALELAVVNLGPTSEPARILTLNLGRLCVDQDRWDEAAQLLQPAADAARESAGVTKLTLHLEQALCDALVHLGRHAEALAIVECALDDARAARDRELVEPEFLEVLHGEALLGLDRAAEAEAVLTAAHAELAQGDGAGIWTRRAARTLELLHEANGDSAAAELWRERARTSSDRDR